MKMLSKGMLGIFVSASILSCSEPTTTEIPVDNTTTRQVVENQEGSAELEVLQHLLKEQHKVIQGQGDFMRSLINAPDYQTSLHSFEQAHKTLETALENMSSAMNEETLAAAKTALITFENFLVEDWNDEFRQTTDHAYFNLGIHEQVQTWIDDSKSYIMDKDVQGALYSCENIRTIVYKQLLDRMLMDETRTLVYDAFSIIWEADKATLKKGETIEGKVMLGAYATQIDPSNMKIYVDGQQLKTVDGVAVLDDQKAANEVGVHDLELRAEITNPLTGQVAKVNRTVYYHVIE